MRTLPTSFRQVSDLNEIIFAHRNKLYGAYELRKHYNDRLLKAFLIAVAWLLLLLLLISFAMHRKPPSDNGNPVPPEQRNLKIFTFEEVKVQQPQSQPKRPRTDQPPTVIVNDTAREPKEKPDSVSTQTVSNNLALNGDSLSNSDKTTGKGIAVDTFSEAKKEPAFLIISEVLPSFPGGPKAFSKYAQKNFDCGGSPMPGENTEGKIILRFVVMKDGSIAKLEVLQHNVGMDCVNEAKNLLRNSPKWNPGLQNNQPVNVMVVLPISIQKGY